MIVVDSSILIEHLRGAPDVTTRLEQEASRGELLVPALVTWELWKGAQSPQEIQAVDNLLTSMTPDPFMPAMARLAGELHHDHRRQGIQRPQWDLLIASHALHHGVPLATLDRDYDTVGGLEVLQLRG